MKFTPEDMEKVQQTVAGVLAELTEEYREIAVRVEMDGGRKVGTVSVRVSPAPAPFLFPEGFEKLKAD